MLYAITGNGTGNTTEIIKSLSDLRDKAGQDDVEFWLILEGKDTPSKTDNAILKWVKDNDVWFEVYTATDATYPGAQETNHADDLYPELLVRLQTQLITEGVAVLALPVDEEGESDEDEDLMSFVEEAIAGGISVFLLNGEMVEIELEDDEDEEPAPPPVKKAAAKKAAAPAKKAAKKVEVAEEDEEEAVDEEVAAVDADITSPLSREELMKLGVPDLNGLAKGQGIDTKGLSKKDLVVAILSAGAAMEDAEEEAEEEAPAPVKKAAKKAAKTAAAVGGGAALTSTNGDTVLVVVVDPSTSTVISRMVPRSEVPFLV